MAFDTFMKVDGIPGESQDDKHKDWIELLSFSHSFTQPLNLRPLIDELKILIHASLLLFLETWKRKSKREIFPRPSLVKG